MSEPIKCQQCGEGMKKTKRAEKSYSLQLLGVLLFVVAIALLFVFPIGTFFGIVLMIVAARMGYSKHKVWLCKSCGYYFNRA